MTCRLCQALALIGLAWATWAEGAEPTVREHLERAEQAQPRAVEAAPGSVSAYRARALADSPEVAAAHARWEAAIHRIAAARQLPQPTVGLGLFLRSVETRVGPQQARIGLAQAFPWPTSLSASSTAASAEARAAEAAFDAVVLDVFGRVDQAYWQLWEIRTTRATHRAHLDVLDDLSATLRARLEVGGASFADLQQLDLSRARLADRIESMGAAEAEAEAALRAAVGQIGGVAPTPEEPPTPSIPGSDEQALVELAMAHPSVTQRAATTDVADARLRVARAARMPTLSVGAEAILTGEAVTPMEDSGKDALVATASVSVPLWQRGRAETVRAEHAGVDVREAELRAARVQRAADVQRAYARVVDSSRRIGLVRDTLLPQAEATYDSLLAAYATGRGTVAQVLMAQRDLLDLRVDLEQARAGHARAWARLNEAVGTPVPAEESP